jgi:hypothetical protein
MVVLSSSRPGDGMNNVALFAVSIIICRFTGGLVT